VTGQFLHQYFSISVEHIHEILQHFKVESRSKQLAVGCPTLPCRTPNKLLVVKHGQQMAELRFTIKLSVYLSSILRQLFLLTTTNETMVTQLHWRSSTTGKLQMVRITTQHSLPPF
jgi:hypothetical protein